MRCRYDGGEEWNMCMIMTQHSICVYRVSVYKSVFGGRHTISIHLQFRYKFHLRLWNGIEEMLISLNVLI